MSVLIHDLTKVDSFKMVVNLLLCPIFSTINYQPNA